jgi:hypothetical protein
MGVNKEKISFKTNIKKAESKSEKRAVTKCSTYRNIKTIN